MGTFEEELERQFLALEKMMAERIGCPNGIQSLVGKSFGFKGNDLVALNETFDVKGRITGAAFKRFSDFAEYVHIVLTLDVDGHPLAEGEAAHQLVYYALMGSGNWCYLSEPERAGVHGTLVIL